MLVTENDILNNNNNNNNRVNCRGWFTTSVHQLSCTLLFAMCEHVIKSYHYVSYCSRYTLWRCCTTQ